jgi:alkylated DNA repair dioxygenase AlkB
MHFWKVNVYSDGEDSIGAHSDDESELWMSKVACLSLGASRIFRMKNKLSGAKVDTVTKHGQLLVMEGNFQREFSHEIPVQKKITGKRISLTFRYHKVSTSAISPAKI